MDIIIAAIMVSLAQIMSFVAFGWLLRVWADRKQAEIERRIDTAIRSWVEPPEEGKPSQVALVMQEAGTVIGQAAARSIMATFGAEASHEARVANGASEVLEAQANPLMSFLAGGRRGKGAALQRLTQLVMPLLTKAGNHGTESGREKRPNKYQ